MNTIRHFHNNQDTACAVYYGDDVQLDLQTWLDEQSYERLFLLADENTVKYCYPIIEPIIRASGKSHVIVVPSGEEEKILTTSEKIWAELIKQHAGRHDLFIAIGGGTITDLGGFVASLYKRGMSCIYIPTTLLAQVDASLGGKTGVDFDGFKNMIGSFTLPQAVFIYPQFLDTLDKAQWLSGYAEMIKHGLIADKSYWHQLMQSGVTCLKKHIERSVSIKMDIVQNDPYEKGGRKMLNFGHTVGHAIESLMLEPGRTPVLHGFAVAAGMICETWISTSLVGLSEKETDEIITALFAAFGKLNLIEEDMPRLLYYMKEDKKNDDAQIQMALITKLGQAVYGIKVEEQEITKAIRKYIAMI
ncbi:MAG: 3-dehydroquinate synthase [Flavobacteriales bacterium]|nr:3-dehydroquinate synthase [Flavobacteriales bacterium]MCZ2443100.1 3-dehydroquinate synthase [Flavobacteriales bacterium]